MQADDQQQPASGTRAHDPQREASRFAREVSDHLAHHRSSHLDEARLRAWLSGVIPFGHALTCMGVREAVDQAEAIGYPVVLKVFADGVLHKTEMGFVHVGLRSREAVADAAAALLRRAREARVAAPRLSVQQQLTGVEMAIGVRRDALGPVCIVAAGGTMIEIERDTAVGMAPLTSGQAAALLARLRIAPALHGYRGAPPVDLPALTGLIARVSELAVAVPQLDQLDLNPVFASPSGCLVADAGAVVSAAGHRPCGQLPQEPADLSSLLAPRRIAVIGGIGDGRKPGGLILHYLRNHGYPGDLVVVSRSGAAVGDVPAVASVGDIPGRIDLACIMVPAAAVEEVVAQCADNGVPSAIVYASGFAETGDAGRAAQERLLNLAGRRLRLVGPNSLGVVVPSSRLCASFGMALETDELPSGTVAFVSQSGALASSLFSRSRESGIGFSHWVSVGNEADLDVADFVAHLAGDPSCQVICLFLEVVRHPAAFAAAAERARAAGKPVIAFKTGRSAAGRRAAASHTGALAGEDESYSAYFERCGVFRVSRLDDLFTSAQGVLAAGTARGPRAGVLSMSGGACSIVADACATGGLAVPALSTRTQERLREILPSFGSVQNPVDITAAAIWNPVLVRDSVSAVLDDEAIDLVLLQLGTNADPAAAQMARDLVELSQRASKPILVGRLGSERLAPRAAEIYRAAGMHVFCWPEQLVQAAVAGSMAGSATRSQQTEAKTAQDFRGALEGKTASEGGNGVRV